MTSYRSPIVQVAAVVVLVGWLAVLSPSAQQPLPLEPPRDSGQSITPAYEGWYQNADGTYTLLVGYFNRNMKQTLDIPVGPNNRIEPDGPDLGQPTHFLPRRQWGVLAIKVPADFGTRKYTWTIVANGKPMSIPLGVTKGYQVEPFKDAAMGNTPPTVKLAPTGAVHQGPPVGFLASLEAVAGTPLELNVWAEDDRHEEPRSSNRPPPVPQPPPLSITWTKHRGDGEVTFAEAKPKIDEASGGKATTTATFSTPGEYVLRLQANDSSGEGGGGFQCCWTNALVNVTVKPRGSTQ
jgi:hypothetical protein